MGLIKRTVDSANGKKSRGCLTGCLTSIVIFAAICVLLPQMTHAVVTDWWNEGTEALGNLAGGPFSSGTSSLSGAPSSTITAAPKKTAEQMVIDGDPIPEMDEKTKKDSMFGDYTIEDFVKGTLNPFGTEGDGDERFREVVIKTECIQTIGTHPSQKEISDFRSAKKAEMMAAKTTPVPSPSVSASPTPTAKVTNAPTPVPTVAPVSGPTPPVSAASPGRVVSRLKAVPTSEVLMKRADVPLEDNKNKGKKGGNSFVDDDGNTVTPKPTKKPSPTPKVTQPASGTPTPTEQISGTPTGSVSATPTATPTPSASPTPTASPTPPPWTEEDERELEAAVAKFISDNTKEEEKSVEVTYTLKGEDLRKYLNSFHTPWQVVYSYAAYLATYELTPDGVEPIISEEALNMAIRYGNMVSYELIIDYPKEYDKWNDLYIKYEERDSVLGKCYVGYDTKYQIPIKIDEKTDLIAEKGFEPIFLFKSIGDWALETTYGDMVDRKNDYGFYIQDVTNFVASEAFNEFTGYCDFDVMTLPVLAEAMALLPDSSSYSSKLNNVVSLYAPMGSFGGVQYIDLSAFTHLASGPAGEKSIYRGLQIVESGAIYSQDYRYSKGYYDCSSLVNRIYKELGYDLSWWDGKWHDTTTNGLAHFFVDNNLVVCKGYDESQMMPGDVILWSKPARNDHYLCVYHAGLYAGDGMIVDASSSLGHVVYRKMWGKDQVAIVGRPSAGS